MDVKKRAVGAGSSGSDGSLMMGVVDERKRKRMISNMESARRSRMKKLKQMDDLIGQVTQLKSENDQMIQRIAAIEQLYMYVAVERDAVQSEAMAMTNRLQYLNEVIYIADEVSGYATDAQEIPELFAESWQLPYQGPQFSVSANMYQC